MSKRFIFILPFVALLLTALQAPANAHLVNVLVADFETSTNGVATAANLNAGTIGGVWVANNVDNSIVRTGGGNRVFNPDNGPYDYDLGGIAETFLAGGTLSYDAYIQRTTNSTNAKKNFFRGFDSDGDEVFAMVLQTDGTPNGGATKKGRLSFINAAGAETHLISGLNSENNSNFTNAELDNIRLEFNETGYDIFHNNVLLQSDAQYRSSFDGLGGIARLNFTSLPENGSAGAFYDNLSLTALQIPEPTTATLGLIGMAGLMTRRRRAA